VCAPGSGMGCGRHATPLPARKLTGRTSARVAVQPAEGYVKRLLQFVRLTGVPIGAPADENLLRDWMPSDLILVVPIVNVTVTVTCRAHASLTEPRPRRRCPHTQSGSAGLSSGAPVRQRASPCAPRNNVIGLQKHFVSRCPAGPAAQRCAMMRNRYAHLTRNRVRILTPNSLPQNAARVIMR
jgi:hypothetical protein